MMIGDNTYVDDLNILASIELYLNLEFHAKHPYFVKVMNIHSGVFDNVDTLLALSVSHSGLDSGKTKMEPVKEAGVCLHYLQFACVLFIALVKVMMPC